MRPIIARTSSSWNASSTGECVSGHTLALLVLLEASVFRAHELRVQRGSTCSETRGDILMNTHASRVTHKTQTALVLQTEVLLLENDLLHSFCQIFDESCVQSFIGRVHTTLGGHSEHTTSGSGRLYVRGERFRV